MKEKLLKKVAHAIMIALILPVTVFAESKEYVPIKDSISRTIDSVEINSLHFVDNTNLPSDNFGLVADVNNRQSKKVTLKVKLSYYDKDKVLLYSNIEEYPLLPQKDNALISMLDRRQNPKVQVADLAYYSVEFEVKETTKETTNTAIPEVCLQNSYNLTDYKVSIEISKDAIYTVEESFVVDYVDDSKILKKLIPTKHVIKNRDESFSTYHLKFLSLDPAQNITKTFQVVNGTVIKIDDRDSESTKLEHTLKYVLAKNDTSKTEHFDFAISTANWNACLDDISFEIEFPDHIDASAIQFVSRDGKNLSSKTIINKTGNKIVGVYRGPLTDDTLNISLFLDDDYFEHSHGLGTILVFAIPAGMVILSGLLWFLFGRDKRIDSHNSGKLPANRDYMKLALASKGELSYKDVIVLIMKLAEDGYIEIVKKETDENRATSYYELVKLKEYAGRDAIEKKLLADLFDSCLTSINEDMLENNYKKGKASKKLKDLRTLTANTKNLKGKLTTTAEEIIEATYDRHYDKLYEKTATMLSKVTRTFEYLIAFSLFIIPTSEYGTIEDILIIFSLLFMSTIAIKEILAKSQNPLTRIGALIMVLLSILVSRVTPLWETLFYEHIYVYGFLFGLIMIVVNRLFTTFMPKKTERGLKLSRELSSLKNYLQNISESDFQKRIEDDPLYGENLFPYIYLLDLEDTFFENREIPIPKWLKNAEKTDLTHLASDLKMMFTQR